MDKNLTREMVLEKLLQVIAKIWKEKGVEVQNRPGRKSIFESDIILFVYNKRTNRREQFKGFNVYQTKEKGCFRINLAPSEFDSISLHTRISTLEKDCEKLAQYFIFTKPE